MNNRIIMLALCLIGSIVSGAAVPYTDLYVEGAWSDLTGSSTALFTRAGTRVDQHDYFVYLRNETYNTEGTSLPFRESGEGTTVGVGYRYWFPDDHWYATVQLGTRMQQSQKAERDLRAGIAGYRAWESGKRYTDLYGELFWVERADDTLATVRARPGYTLRRDADGRVWVYGVGQVWASGSGDAGTENRVEAGAGIGYISDHGWSAGAELRAGHAYRGAIADRSYLNPTVVVAGYW